MRTGADIEQSILILPIPAGNRLESPGEPRLDNSPLELIATQHDLQQTTQHRASQDSKHHPAHYYSFTTTTPGLSRLQLGEISGAQGQSQVIFIECPSHRKTWILIVLLPAYRGSDRRERETLSDRNLANDKDPLLSTGLKNIFSLSCSIIGDWT